MKRLKKVLDGKENMLVKLNDHLKVYKELNQQLQNEKEGWVKKYDTLEVANKQLLENLHRIKVRRVHLYWIVFLLLCMVLVGGVVIWRLLA